jgi:zinc transport system substrate-binding protein
MLCKFCRYFSDSDMSRIRNTLLLTLLALAACGETTAPGDRPADSEHRRPLIVASNYPLYFFASEIAGDSADVKLPEMAGDPANWKPGSAEISLMQSADLIILNGAGYEPWLGWVTLPESHLVDSSAGFSEEFLPLREEAVHQHGPQGEHSHQGVAFTTWLDPSLAAKQAMAIEQAISRLVPENAGQHRDRLAALSARLETLDQAFRETFDRLGDQPVLFSHPVYQYLESRYSLNGVSVHWEPGEAPGTRAMLALSEILRSHPARLMLWEEEPLETTSVELRKLGVQSLPFHTAANRPDDGDFFDVMQVNVASLLLNCCGTTIGPQQEPE